MRAEHEHVREATTLPPLLKRFELVSSDTVDGYPIRIVRDKLTGEEFVMSSMSLVKARDAIVPIKPTAKK